MNKERKDKFTRKFRAELGKAVKDKLIHEVSWAFPKAGKMHIAVFKVAVGPSDSSQIKALRYDND